MNTFLLKTALEVSVPLFIEEFRNKPVDELQEMASKAAQVIAEKGDVLQFGGKKGGAADAFNELAKGLAVLSFSPGGVKFAGLHFQAK